MPIRFRLVFFVAVLLPIGAWSDSIIIDGTRYENVYVTKSRARYYVQIPEEGRVISVDRDQVRPEDVVITESRKERRALLAKWKATERQNQKAVAPTEASSKAPKASKAPEPPKPAKPAGGAHPEAATPPEAPGPPASQSRVPPLARVEGRAGLTGIRGVHRSPIITNRPEQYSPGYQSPPLFVSKKGVVLFTNRPDEYRQQPDFVEFAVTFDQISVPGRFKAFGAIENYTDATLREVVGHYAKAYNIEEAVLYAVIRVESNFNPRAVSRAGARGLMQLMPGTAIEMGVSDVFDPAQNVAGGSQYLAKMLSLFENDLDLALAAYNAGPANVAKYGSIPPFAETQNYVRSVKRHAEAFRAGGPTPALVASLGKMSLRDDAKVKNNKAYSTLHFRNGLTQPAEVVSEVGDHYYVQFENRITRVRKEDVTRIDPARS